MKLATIVGGALLIAMTSHVYGDEVCVSSASDPDGDGLGTEGDTSCQVGDETDQIPLRYNPATGEQINIERLFWTAEDFADRNFGFCHGVIVDQFGEKTCNSCTDQRINNTTYDFYHNADGTGQLSVTSDSLLEEYDANFEWSVDETGLYNGPLPIDAYGERIEGGVRSWVEGVAGVVGFYVECSFPETIAVPECIDVDGDGWGWDGAASCRIERLLTELCVDDDGDGYGWNGIETCLMP